MAGKDIPVQREGQAVCWIAHLSRYCRLFRFHRLFRHSQEILKRDVIWKKLVLHWLENPYQLGLAVQAVLDCKYNRLKPKFSVK